MTVPVAFAIGIWPVVGLLRVQLRAALEASKSHMQAQQFWWNQTYSWALGGPIGRYVLGIVFGFQILGEASHHDIKSGSLLGAPHARVHLTALMCFTISLFSLVLFAKTARQLLKGMTTFESLRTLALASSKNEPTFLCMPDSGNPQAANSEGLAYAVVSVAPGVNLYDMGPWANFMSFWERPFRPSDHDMNGSYWPLINPALVQRLTMKSREDREVDINLLTMRQRRTTDQRHT